MDDPVLIHYENYVCGPQRSHIKYCSRDIKAKLDEQSITLDPRKRKGLAHQINLVLQQAVPQSAPHHTLSGTCRHPHLEGFVRAVSGSCSQDRRAQVWMDRQ